MKIIEGFPLDFICMFVALTIVSSQTKKLIRVWMQNCQNDGKIKTVAHVLAQYQPELITICPCYIKKAFFMPPFVAQLQPLFEIIRQLLLLHK